MIKVTIEFDEEDDMTTALATVRNFISEFRGGNPREVDLNKNLRIRFDKGLISGLATQQGLYLPFLQIKR